MLMSQLAAQSVPCAVGSSSNHAWVERVLQRLALREYVSVVVGGDEVIAAKPHPEVFLRCAELLGVAPSRCAVIEDSVNGVLAARAAGMSTIGFPTLRVPAYTCTSATPSSPAWRRWQTC